jgi:hypothetical protein
MRKTAYIRGAQAALGKFALSQEAVDHILDVAGLGTLAVPVLDHLLANQNEESERRKKLMSGLELGGLGMLAVPSARKLLTH